MQLPEELVHSLAVCRCLIEMFYQLLKKMGLPNISSSSQFLSLEDPWELVVTRAGFEEHNVCRRCSSSGPLGSHAREQSGAAFRQIRYKKRGMPFASCFLASALRVWPSCSEGHEQLARSSSHRNRADPGVKNWGMLLQLLASHQQSQPTLYEAVAWAKNVFQKRALEKHLLVGDCGHTFLMFPLLAFSPGSALAAVQGLGMGRTAWLLHSCYYILQYSKSSLAGPYPAEWWVTWLLQTPKFGRSWSQAPGSLSFGQVGRAAQWERDEVASTTTAAVKKCLAFLNCFSSLSVCPWSLCSLRN